MKSYNINSGYGQLVQAVDMSPGGQIFVVGKAGLAGIDIIKQRFRPHAGKVRYYASLAALLTADAPIANRGDKIFIAPGHTESVVAAAGILADIAGVEIYGLGVGDNRPKITFGTSTGASLDITADDVKVKGIIGVAGIDGLTKPFNVTGDNVELEIEWQDASASVEAATAVRLEGDNVTLDLVYKGFTAGNAVTSAVKLDGVNGARIKLDAYGVNSTAWVEMVDVASENVVVTGQAYTEAVTDSSQLVVDTITGSKWFAVIDDLSAGARASGGSGSAVAQDDTSAIATAVSALQTDVGDFSGRSNLQSLLAVLGFPDAPGASAYANMVQKSGLVYRATAASGMTPSQTTIVCDDMVGFGDDYFNNAFYMYIVQNANSVGNAPTGELRDITDYATATGTFTTSNFTANVEEGDQILIIHNSLAAMLDGFDANGFPAQTAGSVVNMLRALIAAASPAESIGEADIDESEADYTTPQALLTITPNSNSPLSDVKVVIDLDKTTTGWADRATTETIQFYVARKVDGTNWRRDGGVLASALAGNSADDRMVEINIGSVGPDEEVRIEVVLSAEVGADTELPYALYYGYNGVTAPTVTPVAAA